MVDFAAFRAQLAEKKHVQQQAPTLEGNSGDLLADFRAAKLERFEVLDEPKLQPAVNGNAAYNPGWEGNSRLTVIKMFEQCPELEQPFTFKTKPAGGEKYVQAMRVVLSRARAEVKREKAILNQQFKLLVVGIELRETHDEVTVVRSAFGSMKTKEAYKVITKYLTEN